MTKAELKAIAVDAANWVLKADDWCQEAGRAEPVNMDRLSRCIKLKSAACRLHREARGLLKHAR